MGKTKDIRADLHNLIDTINRNELLELAYEFLNTSKNRKSRQLISQLSDEQKKELNEAYEESFQDSEKIKLSDFKSEYKKWNEK